jgi:cellulose synthase/poly-beta-1,6-N-acetylglucosamine synthase-like glycosyltransferase
VGDGIGIYWKYEKFIRKMESSLYSMSGATGAIYAIRRKLYQPIPKETILDDVIIPINIVLSGYRVVFEENAKAYDRVVATAKQEKTRKIRTLSGNYQILFQMPELLNPFKNKIFCQLMSHKVFRLFVPFALILVIISNAFLSNTLPYGIMLFLQICLYLSAIAGYFLSKVKRSSITRLFVIPYMFVLLNYSAVAGLYRYITGNQKATWEKAS